MLYNIVAAIGLLLIFEGVLPSTNPQLWRRLIQALAAQSERSLRLMGFVSLVAGLIIVLLAHQFLS